MSDSYEQEMREMTDFFIQESEELIEFSMEDVLNLEEQQDEQLVNRVFRTFHTIKGNSAMLGYQKLSGFTHKAEDMLSMIREGQIAISPGIVDGLLKIIDLMRGVLDHIKSQYNDEMDLSEGEKIISAIVGDSEREAPDEKKAETSQRKARPISKPKKDRLKMLIVEDEFVSREILVEQLSAYGVCHVAVNGKEAVEAFKYAYEKGEANRFDLICMDIMMPEMDGLEAVRQIRRFEKTQGVQQVQEVTIVMTTAKKDPKTVIKSLYRSGATAYLTKPLDEKLMKIELRKLMN